MKLILTEVSLILGFKKTPFMLTLTIRTLQEIDLKTYSYENHHGLGIAKTLTFATGSLGNINRDPH